MRKLKLQVFMSIDGFIAGVGGDDLNESPTAEQPPASETDENMEQYLHSTIDTSDTILLGRKMTDEFITYWENVVNTQPESPEFSLAKKLVDTPKVVFSKTLKTSSWNNTTLATGDLVEEVNQLKNKPGKDMIVYGGGGFVSSLIKEGLIDEFHLFINPNALGQGMPIFHRLTKPQNLTLKSTTAFRNGVALLVYELKRD
jgi:dihydrofolate reductase